MATKTQATPPLSPLNAEAGKRLVKCAKSSDIWMDSFMEADMEFPRSQISMIHHLSASGGTIRQTNTPV